MTHRDPQPEGITKLILQVLFPSSEIVSVPATSVGKNQYAFGIWVCSTTVKLPPSHYAVDCKLCGVARYAHSDVSEVPSNIIYPKRDRNTLSITGKVGIDL